jgi:hypothetical protein
MTDYDSRPDTWEHIDKVRIYLNKCIEELLYRGEIHDRSKLSGIEKEAFDIATPKLATTEYGSKEYRASLREIKPAVQEHYRHNSHHPEHYENGIDGMSLFDLLEMLCDWKAAGERHESGGNIYESLAYNKERFEISNQLASILENTASELNF